MQFILTVSNPTTTHDEGTVYASEAEMQQAFERVSQFNAWLQQSGAWVSAAGLNPPAEGWAASADGTLSQGPAFEASHYLGGFWIIEAGDEQQAKDIAVKAAKACGNTVELRAMMG